MGWSGSPRWSLSSTAPSFQQILFFLLVWPVLFEGVSSISFLSTACHTQLSGDLLMPVWCVFGFCIFFLRSGVYYINLVSPNNSTEGNQKYDFCGFYWSLKPKWVGLEFNWSSTGLCVLSSEKIGVWCPFWQTILFSLLFLCSHGCASIWEVAWTLHGHYEEEYNTLWGAAGGNVWL